jgi:hypothetical protein
MATRRKRAPPKRFVTDPHGRVTRDNGHHFFYRGMSSLQGATLADLLGEL